MENKELMEIEEMELNGLDMDETYTDDESGSGNGLVTALKLIGKAGVTVAVGAIGVAAYKKLKAKTDMKNKPRKRKKFHIGWVEVEDESTEEEIIDSETTEIENDETEK